MKKTGYGTLGILSEEEAKLEAMVDLIKSQTTLEAIGTLRQLFTSSEVTAFVIDAKDRFGGSELQDYHSDGEVETWLAGQIEYLRKNK